MAKTSTAHTITDVCNLALIQDGADTIQEIESSTDDNAILCKQLFPIIKDTAIAVWEWNGPAKYADLGGERDDDDQEQADWEYVFNLPDDCLHVTAQIDEGDHNKKYPHLVRGGQLFTNDYSNEDGDSAYIDYISISDVSKFSPLLIELIALKLAIAMAPKLMGVSEESALHIQGMNRELRLRVLPAAIGRNQAEGDNEGENFEGEESWINNRSRSPRSSRSL